ncbi:hypothetical protein [Paenirhodobacter populi]|uniref:Uncharacterized protein n=1 Tax=Paenirhodobacter populi TaxID=2306993 RepID=A0A443IXT5_9RHOB|nr:hypothetical protein [Sinirhodobacter populi]RWR13001.1 hypothetical protein D2T33_07315 [Sinirhodobacter populi]
MTPATPQPFNVFCVVQRGRLEQEAVLFALSFRAANPDFRGRLLMAEPVQNDKWPQSPRISDPVRDLLTGAGAEIIPFESRHFGQSYPHGNKIEALAALPPGPFVFFDTDTIFTGPLSGVGFDFARPSASMRRSATWPEPPLYGPGYTRIWKRLYDDFGLDFESSLDRTKRDEYWERYLYFNAGWFFGADAPAFGERFLNYAHRIRWNTPPELACQALDPWLDQIALPLVIHSFGGGRPGPDLAGLDGDVSCHYRWLALLYARESAAAVEMLERIAAPAEVRAILAGREAQRLLICEGQGRALRARFARDGLPPTEALLRDALRDSGLWLR